MLIDFLTLKLPVEELTPEAHEKAAKLCDFMQRICAQSGEILYSVSVTASVRSDSHQISVRYTGTHLEIFGSPARLFGDGDAVFGAGSSAALDIQGCALRMIQFVRAHSGIELPSDLTLYKCRRVDVTQNLLLDDFEQVKQALSLLRDDQAGRLGVNKKPNADSVYWGGQNNGQGSRFKKAKAYAKGPHLVHLRKQFSSKKASVELRGGRQYSDEEIDSAHRLLRLELQLCGKWFDKYDWLSIDAERLVKEWEDFFMKKIGDSELVTDQDIEKKVKQHCEANGISPTTARSALKTWYSIKTLGFNKAKEMTATATWYRHKKLLSDSGLSDLDFSHGTVVPLRTQKLIEARQVNTWQQLRAA